MLQHLWQAMSGRLFLHAGSACLEPCGVRMIQMNYVIMSIMSTCMSALCRHVTKNKSQTDTNFLRVGTCKVGSQEALSL